MGTTKPAGDILPSRSWQEPPKADIESEIGEWIRVDKRWEYRLEYELSKNGLKGNLLEDGIAWVSFSRVEIFKATSVLLCFPV